MHLRGAADRGEYREASGAIAEVPRRREAGIFGRVVGSIGWFDGVV